MNKIDYRYGDERVRSIIIFRRPETPNLNNGLPRPTAGNGALSIAERDLPNRFSMRRQITYVVASGCIEKLDPPVITTCHNEMLVELQSGDGRVVSCYPSESLLCIQGERDYSTIGTPCAER